MTLLETIKSLKKLNKDLQDIKVVTEPRGINGWYVHLCFTNGKCCDFRVDYNKSNDESEMIKSVKEAVTKQLEHHCQQNTQTTATLSTARDSVQVVLGRSSTRDLELRAIRHLPDGSYHTYKINLGKETPKPVKGIS